MKPPSRRVLLPAVALAAVVAVLVVLLTDSDDGGSPTPTTGAERGPALEASELSGDEALVGKAVRDYVAAVNSRDGARVCPLLLPGVAKELDPPRKRGGCAATLSASIGYEDPRGFPVWKRTRIVHFESVKVDGDEGRATVEMVHRFADRPEPSVEDDVIYLARRGDRWLIVKPSSTLYRAVGVGDVPLRALAPPG